MTASARAVKAEAFEEHRKLLWALSYRMTGSAADADDVVQDTFARALVTDVATDRPLRPWLVCVATNLARDRLRRRRRAPYVGPWLPEPVEPDEAELSLASEAGTEGRYDLVESLSFAFLLALEVLTPRERAVLVLCDVLELSVAEAAEAVGTTPGNVKVIHHRARKKMAAYDERRPAAPRSRRDASAAALMALLTAISAGDVDATIAALSPDARALTDGGGEYAAARVPVVGAALVAKFFVNVTAKRGSAPAAEVRIVNGMPALVATYPHDKPGIAPRVFLSCDVDDAGRVTAIYSVLASRKLTALRFPALPAPPG